MRTKIIVLLIAGILAERGMAQNPNWNSIRDDQKNLLYANMGWDFAVTTQVGYGRVFRTIRPMLLQMDYSLPMGHRLTDDLKLRVGMQVLLLEKNGFALTGKALGVIRRHETALLRMINFGGDFSVTAGYFGQTFHAALEWSADGAVITHARHKRPLTDVFPGIHDGWYLNNGVHYFLGLQGSKTIGRSYEVHTRLGTVNARGNEQDLLPVYLQVGLSRRF